MTDRVTVITGATGGLGKEAAKAFGARGDSLVLLSREQAHLDALAAELRLPEERVLTCEADLTDPAALHDTAGAVDARFGGANILLHLAGGWTGGKLLPDIQPEDYKAMLRQHADTTFNLFQAFVPQLVKRGWGRVLMVSSPIVSRPMAKRGAYIAGKAAQEGLFLALAEELKDEGVTANIILVNAIDMAGKGSGTPPEEIVAAMLYLCSEEAAKVNGARLPLY
jgi:3-oxoacyl-[acyl-carrier protein] reductase